jgi:hypothetical protein
MTEFFREITGTYRQRVEQTLIRDFGARGENLAELAQTVAAELPDDLGALLRTVAERHTPANTGDATRQALSFAFDCGRLLERLDEFRRTRAEALVHLDSDGRTVTEAEPADLDRLSRFMVVRDRWLRKAADFSLKLLVTAVVILVLGFALGLI